MYKTLFLLLLGCLMVTALENEIEGRGKKKKIALFIYIADLVLKKFFILKLIYAFVFWVVLHKAGYFLTWFISYLKDHKSKHHEHYDHHEYYVPHQHYEYGPPGPYRKESHGIY